jgi:hypothetical protein
VTVTAMSLANEAVSTTATVQLVPPVTVTVTAAASVVSGTKLQAYTTVTGTTNTAVTWSVSPAVGSISTGGLYTAPAVSAPTAVTIIARSAANTTVTGSFLVTILASTAAAAELVIDGGFENFGQNWKDVNSPGRMMSSTAHSGVKSVLISALATAARGISQEVPVVPGKTLTISGWLKTQNVLSPVTFNVVWLTGLNVPVGTVNVGTLGGSPAWTKLQKAVVVPATAAKVRIEVILPPNGSTSRVFVDDVSLR